MATQESGGGRILGPIGDPDHVAKRSSIHASQMLTGSKFIETQMCGPYIYGNLVDGIVFETNIEIGSPC